LTPIHTITKTRPHGRVFGGGEDRIRIPSPQWGRAAEQKRVPQQERVLCGGEDRIRTCDRGFRPGNRLAGGPIRPLWHLPRLDVVAFAIDDFSCHYRMMV